MRRKEEKKYKVRELCEEKDIMTKVTGNISTCWPLHVHIHPTHTCVNQPMNEVSLLIKHFHMKMNNFDFQYCRHVLQVVEISTYRPQMSTLC